MRPNENTAIAQRVTFFGDRDYYRRLEPGQAGREGGRATGHVEQGQGSVEHCFVFGKKCRGDDSSHILHKYTV